MWPHTWDNGANWSTVATAVASCGTVPTGAVGFSATDASTALATSVVPEERTGTAERSAVPLEPGTAQPTLQHVTVASTPPPASKCAETPSTASGNGTVESVVQSPAEDDADDSVRMRLFHARSKECGKANAEVSLSTLLFGPPGLH